MATALVKSGLASNGKVLYLCVLIDEGNWYGARHMRKNWESKGNRFSLPCMKMLTKSNQISEVPSVTRGLPKGKLSSPRVALSASVWIPEREERVGGIGAGRGISGAETFSLVQSSACLLCFLSSVRSYKKHLDVFRREKQILTNTATSCVYCSLVCPYVLVMYLCFCYMNFYFYFSFLFHSFVLSALSFVFLHFCVFSLSESFGTPVFTNRQFTNFTSSLPISFDRLLILPLSSLLLSFLRPLSSPLRPPLPTPMKHRRGSHKEPFRRLPMALHFCLGGLSRVSTRGRESVEVTDLYGVQEERERSWGKFVIFVWRRL